MRPTEKQIEAGWSAYQNSSVDLCADHDDEQKRILTLALSAALAVEAGTGNNRDMLHLSVAAVLEADTEFRSQMGAGWTGDPLSDEIDGLRRIFSALTTSPASSAVCAARKQGSAGGNDPADCDWPFCGCDPHADKVIAALQECGWSSPASSGVEGEAVAPIGYVTTDDLTKLLLGASCVDLFGAVVPSGVEMVPVYFGLAAPTLPASSVKGEGNG